MKIFWSWQSDTDGKTTRHFVRAALAEAVKRLQEPDDVEEPFERDQRERIHLDHDRQDVSGTPELARLIFGKIDQAAVFVADVTLVATIVAPTNRVATEDESPMEKRLINSNVAVEYGYAVKALGDELILLVQNTHYGQRENLPFDLKHKAGPIQYRLAPDATNTQIAEEKAKLVGVLVSALRQCLVTISRTRPQTSKFVETQYTTNYASFWKSNEVLATIGASNPLRARRSEADDTIEYRFDEPRAFYLRLIPTESLGTPLTHVKLMGIVHRRRVRVLTRTLNGGMAFHNQYGAITYEPHGTATTPLALTQLFRNGEIWAVSREFAVAHGGDFVVPMINLENRLTEGLANFIEIARDELGIAEPYEFELGAIGLEGLRLSLPQGSRPFGNQVSDPVYDGALRLRRVLNNTNVSSQNGLVKAFLRNFYDLAAIEL